MYFIKNNTYILRNRTTGKACSVERLYFEGHCRQILSTDSVGPSTKSANWPCLKVIFSIMCEAITLQSRGILQTFCTGVGGGGGGRETNLPLHHTISVIFRDFVKLPVHLW